MHYSLCYDRRMQDSCYLKLNYFSGKIAMDNKAVFFPFASISKNSAAYSSAWITQFVVLMCVVHLYLWIYIHFHIEVKKKNFLLEAVHILFTLQKSSVFPIIWPAKLILCCKSMPICWFEPLPNGWRLTTAIKMLCPYGLMAWITWKYRNRQLTQTLLCKPKPANNRCQLFWVLSLFSFLSFLPRSSLTCI